MKQITFSDFKKIDMRVGTIVSAEFARAAKKPAYILKIDFGKEIGILKSSAQITEQYSLDQLINKQIIAVVNFFPKQIANIMSQCLVLGVENENGVSLLNTDHVLENGLKIS